MTRQSKGGASSGASIKSSCGKSSGMARLGVNRPGRKMGGRCGAESSPLSSAAKPQK